MIQLARETLLFEMASGDMIPCSAESIAVELLGVEVPAVDPEVLKAAVGAVLHYYRHDLRRETVRLSEFAQTLQTVLNGLGLNVKTKVAEAPARSVVEYDLGELIAEVGQALELALYPCLRKGLQSRLSRAPDLLRVKGLRPLVKYFTGSRRWNNQCRRLKDQILGYLRQCLRAEAGTSSCPMVVE
jgi:hypothetical protein